MNKYELSIDGMRCGMCEIHVEETVEKKIKAKKSKASHLTNKLVVFSEEELTKEDFEKAFVESGYRVLSFKKEKAIKKLLGWR